jgi:hypothetical protein
MPWYSYIGFIICFLAISWLACDFYLQYKMKRIPFMEAVDLIEKYLKNQNKEIDTNGDELFFAQNSSYSCETKAVILRMLEACKNGKITLLGNHGALSERKVDSYDIDRQKIIFINEIPTLHNALNQITFTNLTIEKNEAMQWALKGLL